MNLYDLEKLVCSFRDELDINDDSEVFVLCEDGVLRDFELEYMEPSFDGFDTAFPASLRIVPKWRDDKDFLERLKKLEY